MKLKSTLTALVFALTLFGLAAAGLLLPDETVSAAERRKLAQTPEFSGVALLSGKYADDTEAYLLDQFPLRDGFRKLKAWWQFGVYRQKDNNGIYIVNGSVCKLDKALNPAQVQAMLDKTNQVYDAYLQGMNVHFAVIPDKNYFAARQNGYPAMDYEEMDRLLSAGLNDGVRYQGMAPFADLTLDDYYRTDLHWRQERLQSVVEHLAAAMDFTSPDWNGFTQTEHSPFYGAYCGQAALNVGHDTLVTLHSAATDASVVIGAEFEGEKAVYDEADLDNLDLYDLYLGGAQAILTVENPNGTTGKELILFRDSFGSSLAPLLLESYDKITLIDLRYVAADYVGQFVEFSDQDVLFLYNTGLVNAGMLLK